MKNYTPSDSDIQDLLFIQNKLVSAIKKAKIAFVWELITHWQDIRKEDNIDENNINDLAVSYNDIESDLYEWLEKLDPKENKEIINKKYKLLQPLPDALIGDIYFWNGAAYSNENRTARSLPKEFVEVMSWFKEIKSTENEIWELLTTIINNFETKEPLSKTLDLIEGNQYFNFQCAEALLNNIVLISDEVKNNISEYKRAFKILLKFESSFNIRKLIRFSILTDLIRNEEAAD